MEPRKRWLLFGALIVVLTLLGVLAVSLAIFTPAPVAEPSTTTTSAPIATSTSSTTTSTPTTVTTTTVPTTTTTTVPLATAPLTGLPVEDASILERRVVGVKIDNHTRARPQSGIDAADAVYEIVVEGGITRFLALFHTNDTHYLGPMRSGRPTDVHLMKPLGGVVAVSGAQQWVHEYFADEGVARMGPTAAGAFRIDSRRAPHNQYVNTALIREGADGRRVSDEPPPLLWEFGDLPDGAESASVIRTRFTSASISYWRWNDEGYVRSTASEQLTLLTSDGEEIPFVFDGLIVMRVRQYSAQPPEDVEGRSLPSSRTVGRGDVLVFARGQVVQGIWQRSSDTQLIELVSESGEVIAIPPGRYWISLVPTTGSVTFE